MSGIQLIAGLGNPGPQYEDTRHNAGAWFINLLAKHANLTLRYESKFHALHGVIRRSNDDLHLIIPTTFMNASGQAIQATTTYLKIPTTALLIAHDELDLPVGTIRLKSAGGHGGHNGLRDIISRQSADFYRLRIGIGRPTHSGEVINYVLHSPKNNERELIDQALDKAQAVIPLLLDGKMQQAMHLLHSTDDK